MLSGYKCNIEGEKMSWFINNTVLNKSVDLVSQQDIHIVIFILVFMRALSRLKVKHQQHQ